MKKIQSQIESALFGIAIGDALGVPAEFKSRETLRHNPVKDMIGYGTHNQPPGTWSDDTSLTFCLAEALSDGYDLELIAKNFSKWYYDNYWTPRGYVFDVGISTREAIYRFAGGIKPELSGGVDVDSNGNGSLMRILPLVFYSINLPVNERYEVAKQVSSITHGHIRSVISCFYYLEFARLILKGKEKFAIYKQLQTEITVFLSQLEINNAELILFERLLKNDIHLLEEKEIFSSGYVLHTLEAAVWCLLTTDNYKATVLKAINLGNDTDTTGAVAGGLAGLLYGTTDIPENWLTQIARKHDIEDLAFRLAAKMTVV
jgi:ADP-ribosyl-[dinitrogen reductase] hydrolase